MSSYSKGRSGRRKPSKKDAIVVHRPTITRETLTEGQREAEDLFADWFYNKKFKEHPVLRIGAQAGGGKSTLIGYLLNKYEFNQATCYVMAYTGQAVNRLRQDGILAQTIHSTIMMPREDVVVDRETGEQIIRRGVPLTKTTFKPIKRLPSAVQLLVVDEASFLPEDLEKTLLSYNVPILEFGDDFQLPPVTGRQVFNSGNMDYFIHGTMRQRRESELFDFLTRLRERTNVNIANYGNEVRFLRQQESVEETFFHYLPYFKRADMVICCTNRQRQAINDLYRRVVLGAKSPFPVAGERMICRRNNKTLFIDQYMLTNGTQGVSRGKVGKSLVDSAAGLYYMDFEPDVVSGTGQYYDNLACDIEFLLRPVGTSDMVSFKRPGEKFEYAHAITAHLMQGSAADTVIFMDSMFSDREYLARLRYTAASRARKRLIYMIPYSRVPGWFDLAHMEDRPWWDQGW